MEPQTPVNHEEIVNAMMTQIRQTVQSTIPGFAYAVKGRRRKITTSASAPDDFLEAVAVACDASPSLGASDNLTPAELRSCIISSRAYTSFAHELMVIARGVLDTVAETRNDVSKRARRVYKRAQDLNHPEEREQLVPHVENMKRALGWGRRKRAAAVTKPVPPAPPAPPVAPAPVAPAPPTTPPKAT